MDTLDELVVHLRMQFARSGDSLAGVREEIEGYVDTQTLSLLNEVRRLRAINAELRRRKRSDLPE